MELVSGCFVGLIGGGRISITTVSVCNAPLFPMGAPKKRVAPVFLGFIIFFLVP